jgi:hypothetical protein
MTDEPIDATVVDDPPTEPSRELAHVAPMLAVTPQVQASELVDRLAVIREAMHDAMERDVDYGVIPGTDKPTLYKPGAEKLGVLFQLDIQITNEKTWGPGDHLTVEAKATVYHAPTGARLGYGEGVCTTRERKYAYRLAQRKCPTCQQPAVIKGKAEYGGGWVCFKKKGGCGAKFKDGDGAIERQQVGEIDNPDLPDLWNTVVKMAEKRARVDAVLAVTGASALFTQDAEDIAPEPEPEPTPTTTKGNEYGERPPVRGKASKSDVRRIYEEGERLTRLELLNALRTVYGAKPLTLNEQDAKTRLETGMVNLMADKVPAVMTAIAEAKQ